MSSSTIKANHVARASRSICQLICMLWMCRRASDWCGFWPRARLPRSADHSLHVRLQQLRDDDSVQRDLRAEARWNAERLLRSSQQSAVRAHLAHVFHCSGMNWENTPILHIVIINCIKYAVLLTDNLAVDINYYTNFVKIAKLA